MAGWVPGDLSARGKSPPDVYPQPKISDFHGCYAPGIASLRSSRLFINSLLYPILVQWGRLGSSPFYVLPRRLYAAAGWKRGFPGRRAQGRAEIPGAEHPGKPEAFPGYTGGAPRKTGYFEDTLETEPTADLPGRPPMPHATEKAQNDPDQWLATLGLSMQSDFIASPLHRLVLRLRNHPRRSVALLSSL